MKRNMTIFVAAMLAIYLVPMAIAEDPVTVKDSGPAVNDQEVIVPPPMSGLELEIFTIRENASAQVIALSEQLTTLNPGSEEAVALRQQIRDAKQNTEIAILRAIIRDARQQNYTERLADAEAMLDRLLYPEKYVTPPTPVERPTPSE